MREGNAKMSKSSSWPKAKTVMKKWLNLRNSEFHSDCISKISNPSFMTPAASAGDEEEEELLGQRWQPSHEQRPVRWLAGGELGEPEAAAPVWLAGAALVVAAFQGSQDVRGDVERGRESAARRAGSLRLAHGRPCVLLCSHLRSWCNIIQAESTTEANHETEFQEIVPLNAENVLGAEDKGPAYQWLDLIRRALNPRSSKRSQSFPQSRRYVAKTNHDLHQNAARVSFSDLLAAKDRLSTVSEPEDDDDSEPSTSNLGSSSDEDTSDSTVHGSTRHGYRLAASKQMVGIFLCVWVRADIMPFLTSLKVSCVGRGIMGYMGNKGSISVSLSLQGSATMCFVCTHLASGEKDGDEVRRNSDVAEILKRTRFPPHRRVFGLPAPPSPETILEHDKVIWLGDLNYRLTGSSCGDTQDLLERSDWEALLERDQLRTEQRAGRVFGGWEEGRIRFPPTYKYLSDSDAYAMISRSSRDKKRTPAWCDRILWRGSGMEQLWYTRGESRFSDHRPVTSLFSAPPPRRRRQADRTRRRGANMGRGRGRLRPPSRADTAARCAVEAEEMLVVSRTSCPHSSRF
ncbi:hypothetical protein EJB05_34340 [Eragrostis curvula]|uniref:Inositol polyphosphate-related phosphatase domain-containing protein n=1 Tax=Eragrostis curvula TaxID=38414 RepID=A0A5J9U542_9POAL|nr:hypothetical protein EJB05_34340 [Eragrostis curvula]